MMLTFIAIMVCVGAAVGVTAWMLLDELRRRTEQLHVSVDLLSDQLHRLDGKIETLRMGIVALGDK